MEVIPGQPKVETIEIQTRKQMHTVEWEMMNKKKFFPLSMLSSFSVRCILYPFTVIKTRIQIQKHNALYDGTWDAFKKILKYEGASGLYKGFWINTFQIVSNVFYIGTYESVRHAMTKYGNVQNSKVKGLVGGGCASIVGQTIIVPFDIVSQHRMILGQVSGKSSHSSVINPLNIELEHKRKFELTKSIIATLYRRDGLKGFYRGYLASLYAYVPNSALWWSFYHLYSDWLVLILPQDVPQLCIQSVAAPMGGITTCLLTNPLDVVRARLQIQGRNSFLGTFRILWAEERLGMYTKGLTARLVQSISFSFLLILGYETIKRWSVHEEYKHLIQW